MNRVSKSSLQDPSSPGVTVLRVCKLAARYAATYPRPSAVVPFQFTAKICIIPDYRKHHSSKRKFYDKGLLQ
jgi:hypothetical protein